MRHNVIETVMGAVVLSVAAFFLTLAYNSAGYKNDDGISYAATFDRVDGLNVGSDVKVSGVKVGTIKAMTINPKTYLADVVFTVSDGLPLPKDSSAEINSDGLLGGKYMALVPGGDDTMLSPDDFITHTQSAVSLEGLIGQFIFGKAKDKNPDDKAEPKV